ncbi:MAG: TrmH family RNA methyltransferase [Nannocystaceae bacterium]
MSEDKFWQLVATCGGVRRATERLAPYVSAARKARIAAVLDARVASIEVAIERPADPHNAAAIVRTAEALGTGAVHAVTDESGALHARKVTRGAFYWMDTQHHGDFSQFEAQIRSKGMLLAGACVDEPMSVELAQLPVTRPLCVLFGNEKLGLSAHARGRCDILFHVAMFGMCESLNLSVCAAITLRDLLQRRRAEMGRLGDLDPSRRAHLQARWYAKALDARLIRRVLTEDHSG